ncbi:GAF domain-containing protein [Butyrivibrio sp. WCD3002]|uniref:GAF domain-containing protein n=1 Tax=Butyrivibrio sp. WCD3002 TaxID=1280676 RepID=UPI000407ECEF|nr:GAF domain-containing protein [Butyrivibrio sp. WCD3002]
MAELTQRTDYDLLALQAKGMLEEEPWYTAAMSNLSALIMDTMEKLNWAGFYIMRDGRLVVGPFQGKPACIHIAVGKGVCGTAVAEDKLQLVPDVHQFPGHIACDSASESEIVVPIHHNGEIVAVLDIDSPIKERFDETDAEGLQKFVQIVEENISWE